MAQFHIRIAGKVAAVTSHFESSRDYCRKYLTEEAADFTLSVTREEMALQQQLLQEEAREEGLRPRKFTDPFLERAVIQRKLAEHLFDSDTLLFHGSAVAVDGDGYLFTAKCGTGKSTHTRLWRECFGQRAVMINDDKPFLQLTTDGVLICGSPWSGKHGLDTNLTVPLKGICILERGTENHIRQASTQEALPMLLHQSCPPSGPGKLPKFRELVNTLAEQVPLWQMQCNMEPQAAIISHAAMHSL